MLHRVTRWYRVLQVLVDYTTYTARNKVNRRVRKELNLNPVVLELSNHEKETYTSSSRNISSIR